MFKQNILVAKASPYSITDENGKLNEGISIRYFMNATLENKPNGDGSFGDYYAKKSFPTSYANVLSHAPAIYEATYEFVAGSDGSMKAVMKDIEYVGDCVVSIAKK